MHLVQVHVLPWSTLFWQLIINIQIAWYTEKWAKSFRHFDHSDTDTNMFLERYECMHIYMYMYEEASIELKLFYTIQIACIYVHILVCTFHNKLKTTYLDRKVNRRVDYLLDTLIRMERDQFFGYMYKTMMLQSNPKSHSETQGHERGLSIPLTAIKVLSY